MSLKDFKGKWVIKSSSAKELEDLVSHPDFTAYFM